MTSTTNTRLQWIDAMRGFSMIIVVMGHVLLSMGIGGYDSFLSSILLTFRMPLFFFVSGYFSYKTINWWNKERLCNIIKRKFQAQIICTTVFLSLYLYCFDIYPDNTLGYWFTIVLFQMYMLYVVISLIGRVIKFDFTLTAMIIISLCTIIIMTRINVKTGIGKWLSWDELCKYMQFFTIGLIASKYKERFLKIVGNNLCITVSLIGWTLTMLLCYSNTFKETGRLIYGLVHDIAARYFGLITVIIIFFKNASILSDDSNFSKTLRFIGRRTLDIYMLHFFFLPDLRNITEWIAPPKMIILQLGISLFLTAMIVTVCLLISKIIRESKFLGSWLFGVKTPN